MTKENYTRSDVVWTLNSAQLEECGQATWHVAYRGLTMSSRSSSSSTAATAGSSRPRDSDAASSSSSSILDRLKCARQSELGRKQRIGANPPPVGERACRWHGGTALDPKV